MAWTTVYDATTEMTGTLDSGSIGSRSIREVIPASLLTAATGTSCRVTVLWGTDTEIAANEFVTCEFGQKGATGAYDFTGNQVPVTSDDSNGWVTGPGWNVVSNAFELPETWDHTKDYVFSVYTAPGTTIHTATATITGRSFYHNNVATDEAAMTEPTDGYTYSADIARMVVKIEIDATGAASFAIWPYVA